MAWDLCRVRARSVIGKQLIRFDAFRSRMQRRG